MTVSDYSDVFRNIGAACERLARRVEADIICVLDAQGEIIYSIEKSEGSTSSNVVEFYNLIEQGRAMRSAAMPGKNDVFVHRLGGVDVIYCNIDKLTLIAVAKDQPTIIFRAPLLQARDAIAESISDVNMD